MKKIIFVLIPLMFLSCQYMTIDPEIKVLEDILYEVRQIEYVRDIDSHGIPEYWQSPRETKELGTGDCEDIAFYFAYLAHEALGWDCDLVAVYDPSAGFHMFVEHDGIIYDQGFSFNKKEYPHPYKEVIRYKYHMAMGMATLGYTKNVRGQ